MLTLGNFYFVLFLNKYYIILYFSKALARATHEQMLMG
jgi:hypothetical protein